MTTSTETSVVNKAKTLASHILQGNAVSAFFNIFMGRCTFFAIVFSVIGAYGWLVLGRDLTSFALFAGAIQALLVVRSLGQDYHDRQQVNTTVVVNAPQASPTN